MALIFYNVNAAFDPTRITPRALFLNAFEVI
jgi:hypothetical protein